MLKFTDPPASEKVLTSLLNSVFAKSFKNLNVTLISFRGSGKLSELKYLIANKQDIPSFKDRHLFILLDVALFENQDLFLRDSLAYLKNYFGATLSTQGQEALTKLVNEQTITLDEYSVFIHKLTHVEDYSISFILDNARLLYTSNANTTTVIAIDALRKINPMKISLLFMAEADVDSEDASKLGSLAPLFVQNVVWGKDVAFDTESAECLIKNQEKWHQHTFSIEFEKKAIEISRGDPSVLKYIITKALGEEDFEQNFLNLEKIEAIYNLIGVEFLDPRYKKVLLGMKEESLKCLENADFSNPTEFLVNTDILGLNPLFDYFIQKNRGNLASFAHLNTNSRAQKEATTYLSGQELLVFNLLKNNQGEIVSKDTIAKTLWENQWEEKYSDWAIDKLMWSLRTSLEENKYPKQVKTFKGKGFMLAN